MTGQQLKNSILQMAVQGKLVPQDPNDEPASVLLERIRKEKEQLIKEGKIKKEKNPSYIFRGADNLPYEKVGKNEPVCIADEVPFEIPESWEWVRLGNIFQHNTGKALNASNRTGSLLPYITTSNLYWDRFELGNLREMYFSENDGFVLVFLDFSFFHQMLLLGTDAFQKNRHRFISRVLWDKFSLNCFL